MFKKLSTDEYFEIIKENHKRYLDATMVTHLAAVPGAENKKLLIERYLTHIDAFHQVERADLQCDITGPTAAEKVGRGAFSALLGMGIGALVFAGEQKVPSGDVFGAKTAIQGGFAATIGVSCGALIYKIWEKSTEKPTVKELEEFEKDMEEAGFSKKKYVELAEDLVKLFHFRECLLLGLENKGNVNMRTAFKNRFPGPFNDLDCNMAIEVYFLQQLNDLFHEAFQDIYRIHDKEITDEAAQPKFIKWFKRHFESEKSRRKFTQQMQIDFMNQCLRFLEQEKDAKGFMGRHPYFTATLAGLIAGSIVMGVLAATVTVIPLIGLIGIGLVVTCIAAVSHYFAVTKIDKLRYIRDKNNRRAIDEAIKSIGSERKRLSDLVQQVVPTTHKDLAELKKYDDINESSFLKILLVKKEQYIAMGGVRAWIREFASRFQESKFIQIDLSDRVKSIISDAHDQTEKLQKVLLAWVTKPNRSDLDSLTKCIDDTKIYLKNPANAAFIKTFESIQKIKEQILEIVGHVPLSISTPLPAVLVNFYTAPVVQGGLGGVLSDFEQVRALAPVVADRIAADEHHPYHHLLTTAFNINLKLNAAVNHQLIFRGDNQYRKLLGSPPDYVAHIEDTITFQNIQDYLVTSFDFLCSLNKNDSTMRWDKPFQNTDEFILYRMLLVKQLANLADPNNNRVDSLIKQDIKDFARQKLNCNPDIAFDDILNQALLIKPDPEAGSIFDTFGYPRSLNDLAYVADAVRVDIAYVSTSVSPKDLIYFEAAHFMSQDEDKTIFGYNSMGKLIPQYLDEFFDFVNATIAATTAFIEAIKVRDLLQQTGTIKIYMQVVLDEIDELKLKISQLLGRTTHSLKVDPKPLQDALVALDMFKSNLPTIGQLPSLEPATHIVVSSAAHVVSPPPANNLTHEGTSHAATGSRLDSHATVLTSPVHGSVIEAAQAVPPTHLVESGAELQRNTSATHILAPDVLVQAVSELPNNHPAVNDKHVPVGDSDISASPQHDAHVSTPKPQIIDVKPSTATHSSFFSVCKQKKEDQAQVFEEFIADLGKFRSEEELAATVEKRKKQSEHGFLAHHHTHTREEKIIAATRLMEALLNRHIKGEAVPWTNEPIYQANPHLRGIITKYLEKLGKNDLTSLFQSQLAQTASA